MSVADTLTEQGFQSVDFKKIREKGKPMLRLEIPIKNQGLWCLSVPAHAQEPFIATGSYDGKQKLFVMADGKGYIHDFNQAALMMLEFAGCHRFTSKEKVT